MRKWKQKFRFFSSSDLNWNNTRHIQIPENFIKNRWIWWIFHFQMGQWDPWKEFLNMKNSTIVGFVSNSVKFFWFFNQLSAEFAHFLPSFRCSIFNVSCCTIGRASESPLFVAFRSIKFSPLDSFRNYAPPLCEQCRSYRIFLL